MSILTAKQKRFCEEYLIDFNGTRAAICAGYSKKTANRIASENLSKPDIQAFIQESQKKLSEKSAITLERVLKEYGRIAFTDIRKFYDEDGNLLPIHKLDDDAAAVLAGMDVDEIYEYADGIKIPVGLVKKIKRWDKKGALDSICKVLGFNAPDKIDQNINQRTVIIDTTGSEDTVQPEAGGGKADS